MQDYTNQSAKAPVLSRTWEAKVTHTCYGENWGSSTHIVTISNFDGYTAEIDGQPATVHDAARILESAKSTNGLTLIQEIPALEVATEAASFDDLVAPAGLLSLLDVYGKQLPRSAYLILESSFIEALDAFAKTGQADGLLGIAAQHPRLGEGISKHVALTAPIFENLRLTVPMLFAV